MHCPECDGISYSRKTKTPEWRCRKCGHEWDIGPALNTSSSTIPVPRRPGIDNICQWEPQFVDSSLRCRRINLPVMAVEALRKHRILQLKERMEAGSAWVESGFTFTNTVGNHVDADNLRLRSFSPLLERAGLPTIRFHDLRHTSATLLLSLGTNPKVVQELLGHSGIAVTMDVYSHVLPTMQQEAMSDMDKLLSA